MEGHLEGILHLNVNLYLMRRIENLKSKFFLLSLSLTFLNIVIAQQPNDCNNAVTVCGNSSFSLDVNGIGIQEIADRNSCGSRENNSIWLEINIETSGTLGFTLTPASNDISEDYDFFLFGPNVDCNDLGFALRCSTTNPASANQGNNLTGMSSSSNETNEGPAENGDSFVSQIDALAGENYFLVIDRPIGNSSFSLEWTGTATFPESLSNPLLNDQSDPVLDNLELCDSQSPFDDGITQIDLTTLSQAIINGATNVEVSYYASESDANIAINPLGSLFNNTSNQQTIFVRIENTVTDCYILNEFEIIVTALKNFNEPDDYNLCDDNSDGNQSNGQTNFDFNLTSAEILDGFESTNYDISYHLNISDAESSSNAIPLNYYNTEATPLEIFVRIADNDSGCLAITSFELNVLENPTANTISILQCDKDGLSDGFTTYDLQDYIPEITDDASTSAVKFYKSLQDLQNDQDEITTVFENYLNPQTVYAQVTNSQTSCESTAVVILETSTTGTSDATLEVCDDDGTEDGLYTFNLSDTEDDILFGIAEDLDISYYETYKDALTENNVLSTNYTNTTPYSQSIFARVENANNCYGISTIELNVFELPNVDNTEEVFYCLNTFPQTITLTSATLDNPTNNYSFNWSTGETTRQIQVNQVGTYTVRTTSLDGCFKDKTITVSPSNIASIIDINITDASNNNSISVQVSGEGTYQYSLENATGTYQDNPIFENVGFGLKTVYVRDIKNDCGIVEEQVSVIGFPKFFTPNGDAFNQFWQVQGVSEQFQPESEILIFDRYGKTLAIIDPLSQGWDGTHNGQILPSSNYWFVVKLQDGRTFRGHFALVR